jgi:hypothetical protein
MGADPFKGLDRRKKPLETVMRVIPARPKGKPNFPYVFEKNGLSSLFPSHVTLSERQGNLMG